MVIHNTSGPVRCAKDKKVIMNKLLYQITPGRELVWQRRQSQTETTAMLWHLDCRVPRQAERLFSSGVSMRAASDHAEARRDFSQGCGAGSQIGIVLTYRVEFLMWRWREQDAGTNSYKRCTQSQLRNFWKVTGMGQEWRRKQGGGTQKTGETEWGKWAF